VDFFAWFLAHNLIVEKPLERADAILMFERLRRSSGTTQKTSLAYKQA
jgi:hypothetical protein